MSKKILLSIVSVIVLLIASCITTIVIFKTGIDKSHPSSEIVTKAENSNGKEALIVYQNCRSNFPKEIASSIAAGLNNKGYTVTLNTAGDFLPKDVSKYDIIVLGSATLAGNVGKPLKKYAESIKNYSNSKIILYSTGADMNNMKELDQLSSLLSKESAQKVKFDYSKKDNSKDKAVSLGKEIGIS